MQDNHSHIAIDRGEYYIVQPGDEHLDAIDPVYPLGHATEKQMKGPEIPYLFLKRSLLQLLVDKIVASGDLPEG